jgi:HlyD family secretion protein
MRTLLKLLLFVAVVAAIAVALRLTVFAPEPVPVTVFRAARGVVEDTVTNSKAGTVKSRRRAALSPQVGGRVVALPHREGSRVSRGDVLLRLWDGDLRAQLALQRRSWAAARAARDQACLEAELAGKELARVRRLHEERIVSEDALDKAQTARDAGRAACAAAGARVEEAHAALGVTEAQTERTIVKAPFDGLVAELRTEVGEYVTPGAPGVYIPAILDLIDPDAIYISAPLDEVDSGKVRVDQPVRVTLDPMADRELGGRVVRVAPYVEDAEDQNRTFEIEVEHDDGELARTLAPGTTADVEVILDVRQDVLRVPSYALLQGGRVLVVEGERLAERRVGTGLRNWQFVEITEGLSEGEAVVVSLDRAEVEAGALATIVEETDR